MNKKLNGVIIFIALFCYWVILTERINIEALLIGIIVTGIVYLVNSEIIDYISDKKYLKLSKLFYGVIYLLLLLKEIIIANIEVATVVLNPKIKINSKLITYKTKLKDPLLITILANSITLTPGTLTIEIVENNIVVHCLMEKYIDGVINSKLESILLKIEE